MNETFEYTNLPDGIRLKYSKDALSINDLEIVKRYWARGNQGFVELVAEIAKDAGVAAGKLAQYISALPVEVSLIRDVLCIGCGVGPLIRTRSEFLLHNSRYLSPRTHLDRDGFCNQCAQEIKPIISNGSNSCLAHLSITQASALILLYYSQVDCKELVAGFGLNREPDELASNLDYLLPAGPCRHCKSSCYVNGINQLEYVDKYAQRIGKCDNCDHEYFVEIIVEGVPTDYKWGLRTETNDLPASIHQCECRGCLEEQLKEPKLKRGLIHNHYPIPSINLLEDMGLIQIVALLGLLWSLDVKDTKNIVVTKASTTMPLAPIPSMQWDMLRLLTKDRIIYVDAELSPLDAFDPIDINIYDMSKAVYKVNVSLDGETILSPSELLSQLAASFRKGMWDLEWSDELLPLWKDLAVGECMAYVNERADYYNLGVPGVDKLREIFLALLDDFSVSEIWYMISAAYMSAAAFIQSAKCTSNKHATNIIPSKIISLSEQPSHLVKKWSRIRQIPRCAMSEILFNVMLNDAQDAGFNLSPGRECAALIERQLSRQQTRRVNDAKHSPPSEQELNELISRYDVQTLRNCLNLLEQRRALIQKQ